MCGDRNVVFEHQQGGANRGVWCHTQDFLQIFGTLGHKIKKAQGAIRSGLLHSWEVPCGGRRGPMRKQACIPARAD